MTSRSKVRAWIMRDSWPSSDTMDEARAKIMSPVRMATVLPHTVCAVSTPRRMGAESMTSSW